MSYGMKQSFISDSIQRLRLYHHPESLVSLIAAVSSQTKHPLEEYDTYQLYHKCFHAWGNPCNNYDSNLQLLQPKEIWWHRWVCFCARLHPRKTISIHTLRTAKGRWASFTTEEKLMVLQITEICLQLLDLQKASLRVNTWTLTSLHYCFTSQKFLRWRFLPQSCMLRSKKRKEQDITRALSKETKLFLDVLVVVTTLVTYRHHLKSKFQTSRTIDTQQCNIKTCH